MVLIGFKHVGKSVIGKALAHHWSLPFIDLDKALEHHFEKTYHKSLTSRQIMQMEGEVFFRELEYHVLKNSICQRNTIVSLGGGTPLREDNRALMKSHFVIHITAPPEVVYTRIMEQSLPAFFPKNIPPEEVFKDLWHERLKIYTQLAAITIENNGTIAESINKIEEMYIKALVK